MNPLKPDSTSPAPRSTRVAVHECLTTYPSHWAPAMLRARGTEVFPAPRSTPPVFPSLALRVPPLALTLAAGLGAWLCARAIPALSVETSLQLPAALTFAGLGFGFSLLGVISFRRARTTVNPTTPGAAAALVVSGVYRFTRNPMYLGFLCVLLGELAWLGNPAALLAAPALVIYLNRFQIVPEECALRARFGAEFNAYTTRVPRWL